LVRDAQNHAVENKYAAQTNKAEIKHTREVHGGKKCLRKKCDCRFIFGTVIASECTATQIALKSAMAENASDLTVWQPAKAPSLTELEVLAGDVFRQLPQEFRDLCVGLVIQVEDFPTDEVLETMQAETEFDLLGLFQGVGLPFRSESAPVQMPNMIWLYRRPILDYWAEHDETLGDVVRHVLVHEIGHHFGLSDADMEALEQAAE
jgi:predicted Zn-dependent protease with MMP-like domain